MNTLHITNGDSTVDLLHAAGVGGEFLPWRDILHFGPVPLCDDLQSLSIIRADFLASVGFGDQQKIRDDFLQRDNKLHTADQYDEVIFWFEHELYDQLQLIQLFSWLCEHLHIAKKSTLINPGKHLGHHSPEDVPSLLAMGKPVEQQQLEVARSAWMAFRQKNLTQWKEMQNMATHSLPYLKNAIERSLGELPDPKTGCTQTETMVLSLIKSGANRPGSLFRAYCQLEVDEFHGDMSFFWIVEQMIHDFPPLMQKTAEEFQLTDLGSKILTGRYKWPREYQHQHWLGGYCISANTSNA